MQDAHTILELAECKSTVESDQIDYRTTQLFRVKFLIKSLESSIDLELAECKSTVESDQIL
jgi:hypothetical protein